MDPITLLAAFAPLVTDLGKGVIARWINPDAKPANVEELLKLRASEIDRLRALADLDKVDGTSQWVNNVRALQRPAAVLMAVTAWGSCLAWGTDPEALRLSSDLAGAAIFYLFGDRTLMYLKRS